jgi:uncharacterized protein with von Willebrand factor type A (vWA) domain
MSDRVRNLFFKTKKLPELSESVITHDRLDDGVLDDMTERALHFRRRRYDVPEVDLTGIEDDEGNLIELTDAQREEAESYVRWDNLFSDTFRALHTLDGPEVKPSDEIKPSCELNKRIMQQVIGSDKFQSLRPDTRHDEIASAFTAINLADSLEESLTGELTEMVLRTQEMKEQEDQAESAQEQLEALRDAVREQGGQATQEQKDAMKQAAQQKSNARQEIAQQQSQQQQQGMGANVIDAIDKAVDDAADAADAISNLPGTEPGTGQKLTPDEMIELAEKWKQNPQMQEIAKMLGRMQRDLRYRRTNRIVGGREEIIDVKLGSDLPLLLPHEKMKLRHPLLRRDFMRRFYEDSLLQYETQGYAEAGRGPIIVCIDGSGSMAGMPNIWARAVALSFVTIAKREKRDSACVEFSSRGQQKRWDFFAKQPVNPMKVLDFASHMFNGGTDITGGLELAMQMIRDVPEFKSADIVLATDGHDNYNPDDEELRKEAVARGVRLHGVAIGMDAEQNAYLQSMCETSVSAWDLAGSNDATDHLADMIS